MIFSGSFGRALSAEAKEALAVCCRLAAGASGKLTVGAALFFFAIPVGAALSTLSTYTTLSPQAADFVEQPLSFEQFDPSLGQLKSVRVIIKSTVQFDQQYENTSDQAQTFRARQTLNLLLQMPDGSTPLLTDNEAVSRRYSADPFDGTVDFDGPSGSTAEYDISARNQKLIKGPDKLAMFTGSGMADLFLTAQGTFKISSEQNELVANAQALAGAQVQIIYSYIAAVPEPAGFGVLAGLFVMGPTAYRWCVRRVHAKLSRS